MTGAEIDLREKIAEEIVAFTEGKILSDDAYWGFMRAVGIVREKIWHNPACPCSVCGGRSNG